MKTILNDITLLTAAFNIHNITLGMMNTFTVASNYLMPMVILDNSTTNPLELPSSDIIRVLDNTNFKHTPDYAQASKNHCHSIQYALTTITTKYVMLCDNDILFYRSINDLLGIYNKYDAIGQVGWDIVPPDRLLPYLCIFNVEKMRNDCISYFDPGRCIIEGISNDIPPKRTESMDTGASFLHDIIESGWSIHNTNIDKYCAHIKGATLHRRSNYTQLYTEHMNKLHYTDSI